MTILLRQARRSASWTLPYDGHGIYTTVLCPVKRRIVIIALALIAPWRSASWTLMLPYDGHGIYISVLCPVKKRIIILVLALITPLAFGIMYVDVTIRWSWSLYNMRGQLLKEHLHDSSLQISQHQLEFTNAEREYAYQGRAMQILLDESR